MNIFVARQPIFDRQQNVYAYELLFRSGMDNAYTSCDGDHATRAVISNSFLSIGLEHLTGGKPAFINFTKNLLVSETASLLPRHLIAVELLETIVPDADVINACTRLKQLGYLIVLDDFVLKPEFSCLVKLADIIKIDFRQTHESERNEITKRYSNSRIRFLAEKVETEEEFQAAYDAGYTYFQGYFFSKPAIIARKDVPVSKMNHLQLIKETRGGRMRFDELERIIKKDLSLTFKLLKYINSPFWGIRATVSSVQQALSLLGEKGVLRWITLVALQVMGENRPNELVKTALVRARMGELIAQAIGLKERASDLFIMGMFSLMEPLVGRPLEEILGELPIPWDIRAGLLDEPNIFRDVLSLIVAYQTGDWRQVQNLSRRLLLDETILPELYFNALTWADQV